MVTRAAAESFRLLVIRPTLTRLGLHSAAAEELLLGTALQESGLRHRRQLGGGPARGYFQMEPATHDDIWANYLAHRKPLASAIESLRKADEDGLAALENNDAYGAAMARVHYKRVPTPLPASGDAAAMAVYWKQHYNTVKGRGRTEDYVANWEAVFGSGGAEAAAE